MKTFGEILDAMDKKAGEAIGHVHSVDRIVWGLYIDRAAKAPTYVRQSFTRTYRARDNKHVTIGFDAATGDIY